MRIQTVDTVAVLVDVQEKLFPHIYEKEALLEKMLKLIKGLQLLEVPIIVTEQYTKGLGLTLPELRDVLTTYEPIEKISFSCCGNYAFMKKLIDTERSDVILFGIEAHVCVMQTALDLSSKGMRPIIIQDGIASRDIEDKNVAINRMRYAKCVHTTVESILFELCNSSENPAFKQLSAILK